MRARCVVLTVLLLLGCRAGEPPQAEAPQQEEDYSFEAVSERFAEERQNELKLRSQYQGEVQRCEKELKGTWLSPGSCCVATADGCEPQKL